MSKRTGLVFDERLFHHKIKENSPENPDRIRSLYQTLKEDCFVECYKRIKPREATWRDIESVHSDFYVSQLREHALMANPYSYDCDTYLMDETIPSAMLAAGGCLELADHIMNAEIDSGFALIRPPGHHAEPGRGMGFCVFNNVALTARYLLDTYHLQRIMIVDFDIHHGNGTQEVFYDSDQVMFLSLHQQNLFPFSGKAEELGSGQGRGYTINVPVFPQFGDLEYTFLLGRLLQSLVEQYLPQIILVSAGFDGHSDDSISATNLSTAWYGVAASMLRQYAAGACDGRLLFVLEGGYNPVSLEASVLATLESLFAKNISKNGIMAASRAEKLLFNHPLQEFWTL